jgi:hypothetical protein
MSGETFPPRNLGGSLIPLGRKKPCAMIERNIAKIIKEWTFTGESAQ